MDESYQKAILALVSVFVGWLLGRGTDLFQLWWNNRRLKKALIIELEDLLDWFHKFHLQLARALQIYSVKGVEPSIPLKITHPIYTNFYEDICHKLSREQRRSFELIHEQINAFNENLERQIELINTFSREPNDTNLELWGNYLKAQYLNFREITWQIHYHLRNKKNPKLEVYGDTHKEYLQALERHQNEMNMIIEKAKILTPKIVLKSMRKKVLS